MEQDAPYPPECQGDEALAKSRRERGFNTEPSTTTKPSFWWNPPKGPGGFTVVTEAGLWTFFFGNVIGARRCLQHYLEHMENIRKAGFSASVPPTTLQDTDASRPPSRRQQTMTTLSSSTSFPGVDIDRERNMIKICADLALSHFHEMDEILDVIEMLPERSEPIVSPSAALWTAVCSISAATIPFQPVAHFAAGGALLAAAELLQRPLWYWLNRYNLACLHQQARNLIRAVEEGNISEKRGNDLDSWHLRIRSWLLAL